MVQVARILKEKKKLLDSMGEKRDLYWTLLQRWFGMEINQRELEMEIDRLLLLPDQLHLHNRFLLMMYRGDDFFWSPPHDNYESIQSNYGMPENIEIDFDMPLGMASRGLLYDHSTMLARMKYGALEMGLEGTSSNAAHLLLMAMQHFLKNIVTAIVMRRKGFKARQNGYIHSIGVPSNNMNSSNVRKQLQKDRFESLLIEEDNFDRFIVTPNMRKPLNEIERERAFNATLCDAELAPVSLYDLILTLKLYPSLVSSNFVNSVNTERIYARLRHPYYET